MTARTRWLSVTAATVVMQFSYWPIFEGALGAEVDETSPGLILFGLALMPFVFAVQAFASRHPRAPGAVLRAMGLFIVIGLPLSAWNVVVGVAVGYAAGAVTCMRPLDSVNNVGRNRAIAVGVLFVYLVGLLILIPGFAVVSAAVLPFAAIAFADQAMESHAHATAGASEDTPG